MKEHRPRFDCEQCRFSKPGLAVGMNVPSNKSLDAYQVLNAITTVGNFQPGSTSRVVWDFYAEVIRSTRQLRVRNSVRTPLQSWVKPGRASGVATRRVALG